MKAIKLRSISQLQSRSLAPHLSRALSDQRSKIKDERWKGIAINDGNGDRYYQVCRCNGCLSAAWMDSPSFARDRLRDKKMDISSSQRSFISRIEASSRRVGGFHASSSSLASPRLGSLLLLPSSVVTLLVGRRRRRQPRPRPCGMRLLLSLLCNSKWKWRDELEWAGGRAGEWMDGRTMACNNNTEGQGSLADCCRARSSSSHPNKHRPLRVLVLFLMNIILIYCW